MCLAATAAAAPACSWKHEEAAYLLRSMDYEDITQG